MPVSLMFVPITEQGLVLLFCAPKQSESGPLPLECRDRKGQEQMFFSNSSFKKTLTFSRKISLVFGSLYGNQKPLFTVLTGVEKRIVF